VDKCKPLVLGDVTKVGAKVVKSGFGVAAAGVNASVVLASAGAE
jgi:hypothetical protein